MLEVGAVRSPHGLKGALTIYSHTRPAIGIAGYSFWYIGTKLETIRKFEVERCWQHGTRILVQLAGISDAEAAAQLSGKTIWVDADEVALEEGEFLWADLTGCDVIDSFGQLLGQVTALEAYGAQDILCVRTPDDAHPAGEWMIPFIDSIVLAVDTKARRIEVSLPEGMDACFTPRS